MPGRHLSVSVLPEESRTVCPPGGVDFRDFATDSEYHLRENDYRKSGCRENCFRINKSRNIRNLMRDFFFELIRAEMEKSLPVIFFAFSDFWFGAMYRTFRRLFCPKLRFCFARVDKLTLWAWSDDLDVILFEFLDDDTKLAQSCRDWLYVQRWYTVVPEPSMRVTLGVLMEASLRQCTTYIFVKCVTQFFSLPNFCGRSQCRRHQSLSFLLFVFRVVLSDNFECSFAFVWYFSVIVGAFFCLGLSSNLCCSVVLLTDDAALELGRCSTHVEGRVRRRWSRQRSLPLPRK